MMQALSDKVWNNDRFHKAAKRLELAWLSKELGLSSKTPPGTSEASRIMQAASILSCSENEDHRKAAFRLATWTYELFGTEVLPFDQALRVVLSRLCNFPSISTRADVNDAFGYLPLTLAMEEISSASALSISLHDKKIFLTKFQHRLWASLSARKRIALSAPTSGGKSFVLQAYLVGLFVSALRQSVVYVVPTRALIAQVSEDLLEQFRPFGNRKPQIVTFPIDDESSLPERAIYVMTQERVQLTLNSHPDFRADVLIVDEAHSIADGSRGVLLQGVLDEFLKRNPLTQTLFASPIIRNLNVFGRLFGLEDIVEVSSLEPTVAQNFLLAKTESAKEGLVSVFTIGDGAQEAVKVADLQLDETITTRN